MNVTQSAASGAFAASQQSRPSAAEAQPTQKQPEQVSDSATRIEIGGSDAASASVSPYAAAAAAAMQPSNAPSTPWNKAETAQKSEDTSKTIQAMRTQNAAQAGFAIAAHAGQTGAPSKLDMVA